MKLQLLAATGLIAALFPTTLNFQTSGLHAQRYSGILTLQPDGVTISGTVTDLFSCRHPFSIDTATPIWTATMLYSPDPPCHDPPQGSETLELTPVQSEQVPVPSGAEITVGTYWHVPDCALAWAAGGFQLTEIPLTNRQREQGQPQIFYFALIGTRSVGNPNACTD